MYKSLRVSDVGDLCDLLTNAARAAVARSGPAEGMTCEESLGRYYAYAERDDSTFSHTFKARLVSASVRGDRGTVRVRFGAKGELRSIPLAKVNGRWRLRATPANMNPKSRPGQLRLR